MKRLQATKDRAATLARMIQASSGIGTTSSKEGGSSGPVAVRISSNIAAGDSGLKDATLMVLDGGVLVDTKQTIKVRHVGDAAVAAGTIVTPEPCGRLGLCFTRDVQVVRTAIVQHRFVQLVGPIPGELGTENTDWQWGAYKQYPYPAGPIAQTAGWFASVDFVELPPITAPNITANYVLKMKPLRFKVHGYAGQYCGGRRSDDPAAGSKYMTLWGRERLRNYGSNDNAPSDFFGIGLQDTIAETFHFSPASADIIQITDEGIVPAVAGKLPTGLNYGVAVTITHYRIRVDGEAITGIIPAVGNFTWNTKPLPIPLANYAGKTLEFDLWCTVTISVFVAGPYTPEIRQVVFARADANFMPVRLFNKQYTLNGLDKTTRFLLEFDSNGPEGRTSLLMDTSTETGWTVASYSSDTSLVIFKRPPGSATVNTIELRWSHETPVLTIGTGFDPVSYKPRDNGKFAGLVFANANERKIGTWDASVPTQFDILGSLPALRAFDIAKSGADDYGADAYYATKPQTITVTKV